MKKITILAIITTLLFSAANAMAGVSFSSDNGVSTYTFWSSEDKDIDDLDHYYAYFWGIDGDTGDTPTLLDQLESGWSITGASLSFDNIRNWNDDPNDLYIHLIDFSDDTWVGLTRWYDNQGGGDFFEGYDPLLNHYEDLPSTEQDLTYTFDSSELLALAGYAQDGFFGIGFDPDCHYYNDGIYLSIELTENGTPVPEPATMFLFGTGLVALAGMARKKFQKKQG